MAAASFTGSDLIMEGPLSKWTNLVNGWQYRWFVLNSSAGVLSYYTSKEKMMRGDRRGCVKLKDAQVGIDDEDDSTFTITVDHKTFHFQARDFDERQKWIEALQEVRDLHTIKCGLFRTSLTSDTSPSLVEFERRLAEADVYLELLIDQYNKLEERARMLTAEDQQASTDSLLNRLKNMIEIVKQTILCLQMAKQTAVTTSIPDPPIFNKPDSTIEMGEDPLSAEPIGSEPIDEVKSINSAGHKQSIVPMVSYSSSEDEFYDTEEPQDSSPAFKQPSNGDGNFKEFSSSQGDSVDKLKSSSTPKCIKTDSIPETPPIKQLVGKVIAPPNDLVDELYEDEEEDLGSVSQHGSVITYLLSQLRIGMDLTKIALPTFILERRSTLEMYADFLAHPDLWAAIGDFTTPQERMIACLRWYLSAFHAGRRSSIAKKPYNPILGEIFQCYWDLSSTSSGYDVEKAKLNIHLANAKKSPDTGGAGKDTVKIPVAWAPETAVVFLAEQVSHHPPISAFYAEHRAKGISIDGHLWTKSKFLGLSISVEMIGEAVISLLDYDEEYIITFPCGYGRNILTVPWVELGGKCCITCSKTGYHSTIDFRTKPFYGGKRDQIRAECFSPGEKKPFLVVEGEWNDKMWAKWADGRNDLFVDTKNMPVLKKQVLPRSQQKEYESRRLWENVTYHLKYHNMEEATNGKCFLEQRQRNEAKERLEKGVKWETRYFHEVGEHWVYDNPLIKRQNKSSMHSSVHS